MQDLVELGKLDMCQRDLLYLFPKASLRGGVGGSVEENDWGYNLQESRFNSGDRER